MRKMKMMDQSRLRFLNTERDQAHKEGIDVVLICCRRKVSVKFIDVEQDLYDDLDDKNKEDTEETKDRVGPLPIKKNKKSKDFVSNISKKRIKEKMIRRERTSITNEA